MMQTQKRFVLLKVATILVLAVSTLSLSLRGPAKAQEGSDRLFEIAGMTVPFEQRVGVDDGPAFVVHFAGDTRGSLDSCG